MLRHSKSPREKNFEVRTFNAAALSAQCRGIQARTRNMFEVRDLNVAAFSNECRGIRSKTQKNKKAHYPIFLHSFLLFSQKTKISPQNPKSLEYPTHQSTKILFTNIKPTIQKPNFLQPIINKVIPKGLLVGRKSPKLIFFSWIFFKPTFNIFSTTNSKSFQTIISSIKQNKNTYLI